MIPHNVANNLTAMASRGRAFGIELFSLVTGAGRVGDGGGGLECRFSCKLTRDEVEGVELLEPAEEMDKLVFLRSRIFMKTCIN